jgi:DNA repair exonuclease SbcCD ATPase subunit
MLISFLRKGRYLFNRYNKDAEEDMATNEFNKYECEKALKFIEKRIEDIINFFKGDKLMEDESEKRVQELLENLLDHLQKEYQQCSANTENASKVQSEVYFPFLKDIFSRILIDPKSNPNHMWAVYLNDAQNNIRYYLSKLDEMD